MPARPMLMVYCYDIADHRVRSRAAGVLEDHAVRVQDSVFEMRLDRASADRLFDQVAVLLDEGDSLRMYAVGAAGLERCRAFGRAPIGDDGDYWIV